MSEINTTLRPFSAASFNQYLAEHKLMAARCTHCGALSMPPRAVCSSCHRDEMEWVETGGKGRLAAFTIVYVAPNFMIAQGFGREKPYISGVVELEEGMKISARITGLDPSNPQAIEIGTPLVVEFIESDQAPAGQTSLAFRAV